MFYADTGAAAIWDNRCVYHAPTLDALGPRNGWRVIGVGEKPYLDPNSMSRAEALAERELKSDKGAAMADIAVQG